MTVKISLSNMMILEMKYTIQKISSKIVKYLNILKRLWLIPLKMLHKDLSF